MAKFSCSLRALSWSCLPLGAILLFSMTAFTAPLFVLIDPGHGGRDRGAVNGGSNEADITLAVSRQLRELMKKDRRFKVELTRNADQTVSLAARARLAKNRKADVFLSIHVNSSPDATARGAEFYFQNQLPPDQESMFLAHRENLAGTEEKFNPITYDYLDQQIYSPEVTSILTDLLDGDRVLRSSELSKSLKINWRGSRKSKSHSVRQAPFFVLSQMHAPSTLVELGFLTNDGDHQELTDLDHRHKMAEDLYRGLVAYKESMDKGWQSP